MKKNIRGQQLDSVESNVKTRIIKVHMLDINEQKIIERNMGNDATGEKERREIQSKQKIKK